MTNSWGGSSSATTRLLAAMHYRGLLRVVRRDAGIGIYDLHEHRSGALTARERRVRVDALVDVLVNIYAPLPAASLTSTVRRLRYAVPQWSGGLTAALVSDSDEQPPLLKRPEALNVVIRPLTTSNETALSCALLPDHDPL